MIDMNSSGLASAMLMNIGRRLQRKEGIILMQELLKIRKILAAAENLAKKEQSHAEIEIQASKAIRRKI